VEEKRPKDRKKRLQWEGKRQGKVTFLGWEPLAGRGNSNATERNRGEKWAIINQKPLNSLWMDMVLQDSHFGKETLSDPVINEEGGIPQSSKHHPGEKEIAKQCFLFAGGEREKGFLRRGKNNGLRTSTS